MTAAVFDTLCSITYSGFFTSLRTVLTMWWKFVCTTFECEALCSCLTTPATIIGCHLIIVRSERVISEDQANVEAYYCARNC